MIKAGICGAQGDVAAALIKILVFHPDVTLLWVYDDVLSTKLDTHYRWLTGDTHLSIVNERPPTFDDANVVFVVDLPKNFALNVLELPQGAKVVDLTGTYNLDDRLTYGLSEINRKLMVRGCYRVAVPGDVAHVVELAVLPLAKNLMVIGDIDVDIEGGREAGNAEKCAQEIERLVKGVQSSFNSSVKLSFAAAAKPTTAIVAKVSLACSTGIDVLEELYENYYDDHNFTYIIDSDPVAADVMGTNKCLMHLERIDNKLVITAAIDGLLKGGAATAVHDMNLLFGLHERVGLETF